MRNLKTVDEFLLLFMEEDISLDIKEWISKGKSLEICPFKTVFQESNNNNERKSKSDPFFLRINSIPDPTGKSVS